MTAGKAVWKDGHDSAARVKQDYAAYSDPANLGTLPAGDVSACISSPPYVGGGHHKGQMDSYGGIAGERTTGDFSKESHGYGTTPGQLEALPVGDVTLAVSSPPYADGCTHTGGPDPQPQHVQGGEVRHVAYGDSPQNLGNMASGPVAVVSSPPYERSLNSPTNGIDLTKAYRQPGKHGQHADPCQYGSSDGQLGQTQADTFWSAAAQVVRGVWDVLRPGGHCIWVVKAYCRDGKIVDFPGDWRRMCEHLGLQTLHEHHALLVEDHGTQEGLFGEPTHHTTHRKSFFRRLHEKKRPDLAINFEVVFCMVKPLAAPTPPDAAWQPCEMALSSPPYAEAIQNGHSGIDKTTGVDPRRADSLAVRRIEQLAEGYGSSPGQLGAMPAGQVSSVCISSPPYCHGLGKEHTYADDAKRDKDGHRRIMREKGIADPFYGHDPAQLGNMQEGEKP